MSQLGNRQHDRVQAYGATIRLRFKSAKEFQEYYLRDISRGGIFVGAKTLHEVGTVIAVILTLPEGDEVRLHGRVVHVRGPEKATASLPAGMGIELMDVSPEVVQKLDQYVKAMQKVQAPAPAPPPMPRPQRPVESVQPQTVARPPVAQAYGRLQRALGLEHPPVFLGAADAAEVKRRLEPIDRLARGGARPPAAGGAPRRSA
jgi:uncharacterized protein (TIGR02266 family)